MGKNGAIQILRAAAALLVVYAHTLDLFPGVAAPRQAHFFHLYGFGACGVDIFFAISGFILSSVILRKDGSRLRGGDFLMRRFLRIFPVYWIYSIFFVAIAYHYGHVTLPLLIESYFLLPSLHYPMPGPLLAVGWTLIFEMFFYYVLAINLYWPSSGTKTVIRSLSCVAGLVLIGLLTGTHYPVLHVVLNPINLEFVGGGCMALLFAKYGPQRKLANVLALLGALGLIATIFTGYANIDFFGTTLNANLSWIRLAIWGVPAALLTAGMVFRPQETFGRVGRFWVYLGDASYSIYLSSGVTLFFFVEFLGRFPPRHSDFDTIVIFLIVSAVGTGMYPLLEQPITKFLTRHYHLRAVQSAP